MISILQIWEDARLAMIYVSTIAGKNTWLTVLVEKIARLCLKNFVLLQKVVIILELGPPQPEYASPLASSGQVADDSEAK